MSQSPNHLNHATWECKYHVVFTPKYRKKLLFGHPTALGQCIPRARPAQGMPERGRALDGEFLKPLGCGAFEESIGTLLEPNALLTHTVGEPVMLVEADPSRERKVGTHANKHAPPAGIVDVDVVLRNPTL